MEPIETPPSQPPAPFEPAPPITQTRGGVAPAWHTILLIAGVALLSVVGAKEMSFENAAMVESNRLATYASTIASELIMLAWIYFGLRLRKVPFKSLFGEFSGGVRSLFLDAGIAFVFWIGSLVMLATVGLTWTFIEMAIKHQPLLGQHGKAASPNPAQQHLLHTLAALAPSTGLEFAAWALVCMMAGLIEELVFRGYFQRQFTAWSKGAVIVGVAGSALLFGAAHGYQGARNMVMLSVFGALFSGLTLFRRNLRAAIFAHAWHDFIVGALLAVMKARHLI